MLDAISVNTKSTLDIANNQIFAIFGYFFMQSIQFSQFLKDQFLSSKINNTATLDIKLRLRKGFKLEIQKIWW